MDAIVCCFLLSSVCASLCLFSFLWESFSSISSISVLSEFNLVTIKWRIINRNFWAALIFISIFLSLSHLFFSHLTLSLCLSIFYSISTKVLLSCTESVSSWYVIETGKAKRNRAMASVWPDKNCQMSIKVAQIWFHKKNEWFWYLYKNYLRMWEIWAN